MVAMTRQPYRVAPIEGARVRTATGGRGVGPVPCGGRWQHPFPCGLYDKRMSRSAGRGADGPAAHRPGVRAGSRTPVGSRVRAVDGRRSAASPPGAPPPSY